MENNFVYASPKQIQDLANVPDQTPFQVLNLLKFKEKLEGSEISGAEAFNIYMQAAMPFFQKFDARVVYDGTLTFTFIGPDDDVEWDKVFIVEYASKKDFIGMIMSEGYPTHLRSQALQDSRLILCTSK